MHNLTEEDVSELRKVLEDLPAERREKILQAFHSGRLLSFVAFIDSVVTFFETLGKLGSWVNKVIRPFLTALLFLFAFYLYYTGGNVDLTKLLK